VFCIVRLQRSHGNACSIVAALTLHLVLIQELLDHKNTSDSLPQPERPARRVRDSVTSLEYLWTETKPSGRNVVPKATQSRSLECTPDLSVFKDLALQNMPRSKSAGPRIIGEKGRPIILDSNEKVTPSGCPRLKTDHSYCAHSSGHATKSCNGQLRVRKPGVWY
jgi:hypothetical protein